MSETIEIIEKGAIEYIRKNCSIFDESPANKKSTEKRKSKIRYILFFLAIVFVAIAYLRDIIVWLFKEICERWKDLCEGLSYIGTTKLICGAMAAKYSHKIEVIYEMMKTWTP